VSRKGITISRVRRSKAEAKASYDRMSGWYDRLAGSSEKKFVDVGLRKLCAQPGEVVLEIGFGTGHGILSLAQAVGDAGRVYGIDISQGMFDITEARVREAGLAKRVELKRMDAETLPFSSGFFDAIFMSFTLELFDTPEIPMVLGECYRTLRSGGRICVVTLSKEENPSCVTKIYEWIHSMFPKYVDCRPIQAQRALEEAGFRPSDAEQLSMWGLPVEIVVASKAAL
jgi:ubiquinone/menaquinone biosynthesis C-methylase UbiE